VIKYKDISNSTLQVPFIMALKKGSKWVNGGMVAGPGIILRLRITTTANTKTETAAIKRNINLSVICDEKHESRAKNQDFLFFYSYKYFALSYS
jgi:hypothetical protein